MCDALPGFHALDYTAAFNNKGKTKPFKIMEGNKEFQNAFAFAYVRVLIVVL